LFKNLKYLEANGTKIPLAFTMNVMQEIQRKYGSINKISEMAKDGSEPDIEAIIFFLKEAINEGIDIENERNSEKKEFLSEKQVGRLLSEVGMIEAMKSIGKAISESVKTGDQKNVKPAKNQTKQSQK
jgi:hypothetical protein